MREKFTAVFYFLLFVLFTLLVWSIIIGLFASFSYTLAVAFNQNVWLVSILLALLLWGLITWSSKQYIKRRTEIIARINDKGNVRCLWIDSLDLSEDGALAESISKVLRDVDYVAILGLFPDQLKTLDIVGKQLGKEEFLVDKGALDECLELALKKYAGMRFVFLILKEPLPALVQVEDFWRDEVLLNKNYRLTEQELTYSLALSKHMGPVTAVLTISEHCSMVTCEPAHPAISKLENLFVSHGIKLDNMLAVLQD